MILVDLAIKSVFAATFGWFAVCLLKRSSASTRHVVSFMTLIGVSVLPITLLLMPRWHVPFIKLAEKAAEPNTPTLDAAASHISAVSHGSATPTIAPAALFVGIWIAIAVILCLKTVIQLVRLHRAERSLPMSCDQTLQALVAELCRKSGRHVVLLEGQIGEPPMTWGSSRPVLVLPSDAGAWPKDRLHSVVLHELAHIERGDWLASIFAQLSCAVYWFNPFVWLLRKRMELESETAADDRVLSLGVPATQYASHLLNVTRELHNARTSTNVALAMARPGNLDRRVRAILEASRCRRSVRGIVTLSLAATIAGVVFVVGAAAPTIVREAHLIAPTQSADRTFFDGESMADLSTNTTETGTLDFDPSVRTAIPVEPTFPQATKKQSVTKTADKKVKLINKLASSRTLDGGKKPSKKPLNTVLNIGTSGSKSENQSEMGDIKIELGDLAEEMRKAGVQVDGETEKALKEVSNIKIDTRGIMNAVAQVTSTSTKAAIRSAQLVAQKQIAEAFKELKHKDLTKPDPPAKTKH